MHIHNVFNASLAMAHAHNFISDCNNLSIFPVVSKTSNWCFLEDIQQNNKELQSRYTEQTVSWTRVFFLELDYSLSQASPISFKLYWLIH